MRRADPLAPDGQFLVTGLRFGGRSAPDGQGEHAHNAHAADMREGDEVARPYRGMGAIDPPAIQAHMPVFGKLLRD